MSDDRAGARVAAVLDGRARLPPADPVSSRSSASTEPAGPAEPDFTPVSVESLHRVLDGLRQLK
jgi:hypothetical protein